jgi:uncharacterized protein (DUF2141 family)
MNHKNQLRFQRRALLKLILAIVGAGLPAAPCSTAAPAAVGDIRVVVVGLRSDSGRVVCTLFHSPKGFPSDDSDAQTLSVPIVDRSGTCDFKVTQDGKYAAVVFHDENGDGKFNQNLIGLPKEGYGFSRDASISWRAPHFDEASFDFDGGNDRQVIHIRY